MQTFYFTAMVTIFCFLFSLPVLVLFYIGSITVGHLSSGRQPHCGMVSSCDRAVILFNIGRLNCLVACMFCSDNINGVNFLKRFVNLLIAEAY